jgi:hypothetical protein
MQQKSAIIKTRLGHTIMASLSSLSSVKSQRDRISIDVGDLREQVETCRNDVAWSELPLSAKLRVLIKERLEEMRQEQSQKKA